MKRNRNSISNMKKYNSVFTISLSIDHDKEDASDITMEDIIEEVVGEIDVGYDFDEYTPKKRHQLEEIDTDVYVMDARVPISEAGEVLGVHLSDREAHTVGGLVTARLRRIPMIGDSIEAAGYVFVVLEASDRAAEVIQATPQPQ